MLTLYQYSILERINVKSNFQLFRAERVTDSNKVLLKIAENTDYESIELYRQNHEYAFAKDLSFRGIARFLNLEIYSNQSIIVIENIDGTSLNSYLSNNKPSIHDTLTIAIAITDILEFLFQKDVVLQNLCPSHLLVDSQTLKVNLIDFSIASRLSPGSRIVENRKFSQDSLAYISPEQTGRIKGEIDIRSDLYSLGVILYELLTARLPFEENDALSLIHSHIARRPIAPNLCNPHIPVGLSSVIMKLLSKEAADRYQSPFGLKMDLQECLHQWTSTGRINLIEIGKNDFSGRLKNPKQFYGRENEIATLRRTFDRVRTGAVEVVLIEGHSGVGKSALVHTLKDSFVKDGSIFIEGKFNQFQKNDPYFAFIQAFKEFADFILAQPQEKLTIWREEILKAVGVHGTVLTNIIPQLELVIGVQPALPELEANETQNRFHYVFLNFIKCITLKSHPLVIFFDDLQWSDAASSNLLKIITTDKDLQSLLFIGAYRENEIAANPILSVTVEDLLKEGVVVQKIILPLFPYRIVAEIVCEILGGIEEDNESLIKLVYDKSLGNPFFINAFIKGLHAEKILKFDFNNRKWQWDPAKIGQLKFTEDIVELMAGRIQKLPEATQELLKLAACLGYRIDIRLLMIVLEQKRHEITDKLKCALDEGLILLAEENYTFSHDRIQQAAYSLIQDEEKKYVHLRIGRALLQSVGNEANDPYIFEIVNQLNAGIEAIALQKEKDDLAELNLTAGIKAKSFAAFKPSFDYLQIGIGLLDNQAWKNHYQLTLQLYTEGAECGFLSGNKRPMEEWINVVLENVSNVLDQVKVYETRIKFYIAEQQLLDAVQTSLKILELLNIQFPKKPTNIDVLFALFKIRLTLRGKSLEDLIYLPTIKNPYAEASIRILAIVGSAVYFAMPKLFPLFVCKAFSLMIQYGNTPYSGVVCASYGVILLGGIGNIEAGYQLGKIAMKLSEKFERSSFKYQCTMVVNNFLIHWKEHLQNILEPLRINYGNCLGSGNPEYAAYSAELYCYSAFFCGKNLKELTAEMMHFLEAIQQLRQEVSLNLHKIHTQAVLNLQLLQENPTLLTGKVHNEGPMLQLYKETKAEPLVFDVYLYKLILSYIFEKYHEAEVNAREAGSRIECVAASAEVTIFYFYDTLTKLSLFLKYSGILRKRKLQEVYNNLRKFKKFTRYAPMNCFHKLLLMEAELSRVRGHIDKAALLYDKAISEARKNEYLNDLALACELAGKFYQTQQRELIAQHYLIQAHKFYQQWGALAKVKDMEKKLIFISEQQRLESTMTSLQLSKVQKGSSSWDFPLDRGIKELDLHSIMKAATAISSEVELDKLLKKLVRIGVENAGAQQGYLILKKDEGFFIEAESSIDAEEAVVVQSIPMKGNKVVSEGIVQFVVMTKELLVIDNAIAHPNFSSDPIIRINSSKSVLCMPIIHQGDVIGLLYFENDLITHAFTQDRIEFLKLLSGQMAISLQNALNEQKKMNVLIEREKLLNKINLHEQELLKTKLEIQEQTYHDISEEIHDNIGQVLTLVKLNLNTIDLQVIEAATEKIHDAKEFLSKAIQDLRDLSKTLNTNTIIEIGIIKAIEIELEKLEKTETIQTHYNVTGVPEILDPKIELILFRIVQESLHNIIKHAKASSVKVSISCNDLGLLLIVEDDGVGFDAETKNTSGNGLKNIESRCRLIQAKFDIKSSLGQGTKICVHFPYVSQGSA